MMYKTNRYNESHPQAFTLISDELDDINVKACTCDLSYRAITKFSFFAVLERWPIYDCETECSFVYLITDTCWP